jgi:hypothetical protein
MGVARTQPSPRGVASLVCASTTSIAMWTLDIPSSGEIHCAPKATLLPPRKPPADPRAYYASRSLPAQLTKLNAPCSREVHAPPCVRVLAMPEEDFIAKPLPATARPQRRSER